MATDEEYTKIYDPQLAHIQISITDTDDRRLRRYERTSAPSARIGAVERLEELGFDVVIRLSPFIPGPIGFTVLNAIRSRKIVVEFLRLNARIIRKMGIARGIHTPAGRVPSSAAGCETPTPE